MRLSSIALKINPMPVILTNSSVNAAQNDFLESYIHCMERHPQIGIFGYFLLYRMFQSLVRNNFTPHLQSFFLLTTTSVLREIAASNQNRFPGAGIGLKLLLIRKGEVALSRLVLRLGYRLAVIRPGKRRSFSCLQIIAGGIYLVGIFARHSTNPIKSPKYVYDYRIGRRLPPFLFRNRESAGLPIEKSGRENIRRRYSSNDALRLLERISGRIRYIHSANIGYGGAHNIAMREAVEPGADYHVIVNPDIWFGEGVIEILAAYMDRHPDAGLVAPKTVYPDGETQYLCKLLPTPFDLILRRFLPAGFLKSSRNVLNCALPVTTAR